MSPLSATRSDPARADAPAPGCPLAVGERAPDFVLTDQYGGEISLTTMRADGKHVLVVFFPFAFSGICAGELAEIQLDIDAFSNERIAVVGISCDPMYSLKTWAAHEGYRFPLLSDFWPHGEVASAYGVLDTERGWQCAARSSSRRTASSPGRWSTAPANSGRSVRCTRRSAPSRRAPDRLPAAPRPSPRDAGACSSGGRAPRLHRGCRRFEPGRAHHGGVSGRRSRRPAARDRSRTRRRRRHRDGTRRSAPSR